MLDELTAACYNRLSSWEIEPPKLYPTMEYGYRSSSLTRRTISKPKVFSIDLRGKFKVNWDKLEIECYPA